MISVIIPNWNGARHVERCLDSLAGQTLRDFDVWVVDNGSTDDSPRIVEQRYAWVRLLRLSKNIGFAGAVNRGIAASRGDIVALLNVDTECDPRWLEALQQAFDAHPEAGFCASLMLEMRDTARIASAGDFVTLSGTAFSRWQGEAWEEHKDAKCEWVFGACGGAAAYRRRALEVVGLFEESFFIYFEDVDISFRLQRAGFPCLFVPDSIVWHLGHSSITNPARRAWAVSASHRNQIWMIARNFPTPLLRRHWKDILTAQVRSIVSAFIHPGAGPASAVLRGKLLGLLGLPRCLKFRRQSLAQHPGAESLSRVLEPPVVYRSLFSRLRSVAQGRERDAEVAQ